MIVEQKRTRGISHTNVFSLPSHLSTGFERERERERERELERERERESERERERERERGEREREKMEEKFGAFLAFLSGCVSESSIFFWSPSSPSKALKVADAAVDRFNTKGKRCMGGSGRPSTSSAGRKAAAAAAPLSSLSTGEAPIKKFFGAKGEEREEKRSKEFGRQQQYT
jgi:hypothetical protein